MAQAAKAAPPTEAPVVGIKDKYDHVRRFASSVLRVAKETSPVVKYGLETVEYVASPVVTAVESRVVDPVITKIDSKVESGVRTAKALGSDVVATSTKVSNSIAKKLDFDENGYVTLSDVLDVSKVAIGQANDIVNSYWTSALLAIEGVTDRIPGQVDEDEQDEKSPKADDHLLPPTESPETSVSMKSVASRVSKKIIKKAQFGLATCRQRSAEALSNIVHVDLIAYAETVIDKTSGVAPEPAREKLRGALAKVKTTVRELKEKSDKAVVGPLSARLEEVKERVSEVKDRVAVPLVATVEGVKKETTAVVGAAAEAVRVRVVSGRAKVGEVVADASEQPFVQELRLRLQLALLAARALAAHRATYLWDRQLTKVPTDAYLLLLHVCGLNKADHEFDQLDGDIVKLLGSIRDVLFWQAPVAQDGDQVESSATEDVDASVD